MIDSNEQSGDEPARQISTPIWLRMLGGIVALVLVLLLGIRLSSSWSELQPLLLNISPLGAILALTLMISGEALVGVAWGLDMRSLGARPSLVGSTAVHFVSSLGRAAPGMVATVAGRVALSERAGVSRKLAGAGMLMELVLSATGALLIGIPAAIAIGGLSFIRGYSPVSVAAGLAILVAAGLSAGRWLIPTLRRRWGRDIAHPSGRTVGGLIAMYSAIWYIYGLSIFAVSTSAGIAMPPFWITGGIFALSWLVGFAVFFVPGGLGIREGMLVLLLSPVVPNAEAVLVALVARVLWWLTTLVIAAAGSLWLSITSSDRGTAPTP